MKPDPRCGIKGSAVLAGFTVCIQAANWIVGDVGATCVLDGPRLTRWRLALHRRLGRYWALAAVGFGAILSAIFAPRSLIFASTAAFLLSDLADLGGAAEHPGACLGATP